MIELPVCPEAIVTFFAQHAQWLRGTERCRFERKFDSDLSIAGNAFGSDRTQDIHGRSSRLDSVQMRYSEYLVYVQYVDGLCHVLFVSTLYIVSFAYARLRSAQRINGPP